MDILVTEQLTAPPIEELAAKYDVVRDGNAPGLLAKVRAIMIRNQTRLTREALASAKSLLAIGRVGVGLDNIDLKAATEFGIVVIAPLDANAVSVAELTLGLMIGLARKIPHADRSTKAGQWDRAGCTGIELNGKTLTLLGLGRIGRLVAARARAFGMRILAFDPFVKTEREEVIVGDILEAVAQADFVSAHLPLTDQTRGMVDGRVLGAMRTHAFVINTSRGGIVDERALLAALQQKQIAGAALDVRAVEPPIGANPLAAMDNVILTPHIGAFTVEAQARTFEAVCSDLDRILCGEPAINYVNFPSPRK